MHPDMFVPNLKMEDLRRDLPPYGRHCGTVWPQVCVSWALACHRHGHYQEAESELFSLARKAARDGQFREVYHPETGEPYGGLQEFSSAGGLILWPSACHQTWCATGFFALLTQMICGMQVTSNGLTFRPRLPEGVRHLEIEGLQYQGKQFDLHVERASHSNKPMFGQLSAHSDFEGEQKTVLKLSSP